MSWGATIPNTPPAEFAAAVDGCSTSPPEEGLADEPKAQLAVARTVAKEIAGVMMDDGKLLAGSLNGHACSEGDGSSPYDSLNVSVRQVPAESS